MKVVKTLRCAAVQVSAVLLIAGCGGGGSSGGPSAPPTANALSLTNVKLPAVNHEVFEGADPIPSFRVEGDLTGDISQLNGKTMFVVLEDPDQLVANSYVILSGSTTGNTLVIEPKSVNSKVGHFKGSLRISLCLDAACVSRIGNTPVMLPYDITVLPGLKASTWASIDLQTAFGDTTQANIGVTLPAGVQSWNAFWLGPPTTDAVSVQTTDTPSPTVIVKGGLTRVGSVASTLSVTATALTSTGRQVLLQQQTPINYTVSASTMTMSAQPSSAAFTMRQYSNRLDSVEAKVVQSSGVHANQLVDHVEYLPAGSSGNVSAGGFEWLIAGSRTGETDYDTLTVSAHACAFDGSGSCLATGRYDALVHLRSIAVNGNVTLVTYPVSLTVTP